VVSVKVFAKVGVEEVPGEALWVWERSEYNVRVLFIGCRPTQDGSWREAGFVAHLDAGVYVIAFNNQYAVPGTYAAAILTHIVVLILFFPCQGDLSEGTQLPQFPIVILGSIALLVSSW